MFGWLQPKARRHAAPWEEFDELATTDDGWAKLYRHPTNLSLWELTYPHSEQHGGGPPSFKKISPTGASVKYGSK
jgi:hypothetical protein